MDEVRQAGGGRISEVLPDSIAEEIGLEPGDILVSINGHVLRDQIDYRFYGAEETLILVVERAGERHTIEIERDYDEELGLVFSEPVFDGMRQCQNHCPFCFVRQMPRGMRRSLYLRDDDYRYSFLLGNFVTLTNLEESDWRRIGEQRLSPLYVSVHATDLASRRRLLGNPRASDIVAQLQRLGRMGIKAHCQIVIVPGMNDGEVLRHSIAELRALWPVVQTLALVPVGLTRFHRRGVRLLRHDEAAAILDLAAALIPDLRAAFGSTWLYPSDELYLLAGRQIPGAAFYDDPAQEENGVGLVRGLLDDWEETRQRLADCSWAGERMIWVCGRLIAPVLEGIAAELAAATGREIIVRPVANRFFGESVTVSGLLTGGDVVRALEGETGGAVVLPRAMFDASGALTLDDMTLDDLKHELGGPVAVVGRVGDLLRLS